MKKNQIIYKMSIVLFTTLFLSACGVESIDRNVGLESLLVIDMATGELKVIER